MKFCKVHSRVAENLRYQAQRQGQLQLWHTVMADPGKARCEIPTFLQSNPTSSSRKHLVDFSTWERNYGARVESRVREREVLLNIDEYWNEVSKAKGISRNQSDMEFQDLLKGPCEREGEGAFTKIWVQRPKERYKDTLNYVDAM
eukprot:2365212-Amphidinium_carterae.1